MTTKSFKKTEKQREATRLMASDASDIMLLGGSRSGKTFIIVRNIIIRASKVKSRHVSFRTHFNHAKTSIWLETLPKVLDLCFPHIKDHIKPVKTDHYLLFPNGSEYWIAGLDDKKRTEKILGKEYSTIHFNECSQIQLDAVNLAKTRLAEQNELKKKLYYDENPPNKAHWSYWQFVEHTDPETNEPLKNPDSYRWLLMNPADNRENIDPSYFDILANMGERERARFEFGEFADVPGGAIYYQFDRSKHFTEQTYRKGEPVFIGQDFNVDPMASAVYQRIGGRFVCVDEIWRRNSNTPETCKEIKKKYTGSTVYIRPDASGRSRTTQSTTSKSDIQIMRDFGFKIQAKKKNPLRVDRWATTNRALEKGWVLINPQKAPNVVKDYERMIYKEGTSEPEKIGALRGHSADASDYAIYWEYPMHARVTQTQGL